MAPRGAKQRAKLKATKEPDHAPAADDKDTPIVPQIASEPESRIPAYFGILIVATSTFALLYFVARKESKFTPTSVWEVADLSSHNGSDPSQPLLLAIVGNVFDVSKGADHYGVGKQYNHFCGRDASRAFVSGNFTGDGLTDNVNGLSLKDLGALEGWRSFYFRTYPHVGKVVGRYYSEEGDATRALDNLERKFVKAAKEAAEVKAREALFPPCNSKWSSEEGGKVWCGSGFPRKQFSVDTGMPIRCACIQEGDLGMSDLNEYDNCPPRATTCITKPPTT